MNKIQTFVEKAISVMPKKGGSLLDQIAHLSVVTGKLVEDHKAIDAAFKVTGIDGLWKDCDGCQSSIVYNYGVCPYCGHQLYTDPKNETAVVEEEPKKVAKKVAAKKASKKKVVEEDDDFDDEEEGENAVQLLERVEKEKEAARVKELAEQAKTKTKTKTKAKAVKPKPAPEPEEEEEFEFPTVDEVNAMKKAQLAKLIKDGELEVDLKVFPKLKDLRAAVNNAIDNEDSDYEEPAALVAESDDKGAVLEDDGEDFDVDEEEEEDVEVTEEEAEEIEIPDVDEEEEEDDDDLFDD